MKTFPDAPAGPTTYAIWFLSSNKTVCVGSFGSSPSSTFGAATSVGATVAESKTGTVVLVAAEVFIRRELPGPPATGTVSVVVSGEVLPAIVVEEFSLSIPVCNTGRNSNSPVRPIMSSACC